MRISEPELSVVAASFSLSGWRNRGLIMNEHSGDGVVPGRYAGKPIQIHSRPTPEQIAHAESKSAADGLAGKIAAAASLSAQASAVLLELVGEFDATGAVRFWTEVKSVALGDLRPGEALGASSLRCGPRRNSSRGMPYASSVPLDVQAPRPGARLAVQEVQPTPHDSHGPATTAAGVSDRPRAIALD